MDLRVGLLQILEWLLMFVRGTGYLHNIHVMVHNADYRTHMELLSSLLLISTNSIPPNHAEWIARNTHSSSSGFSVASIAMRNGYKVYVRCLHAFFASAKS